MSGISSKFKVGAAVAAVTLLGAGCASTPGGDATAEGSSEVLKVGVLTDLTSIFSIYGIPNSRAVELGLEYATDGTMEVAGRKIEVITRDDQNNPETGLTAARELIEREDVSVILGTMSSGVTQAVMEFVDGQDVIYMPVASAEEVTNEWFTENTFRISRNIQIDANAMAQYVASEDAEASWAILAPNYALGESAVKALHDSVESTNMSFVDGSDVMAPPDATDFTPYLQQIKASGAEYLANFWVADQTALYQQMSDIGLDAQLESIGVLANDPLIPDVYPVGALGTTPYRYDLIDNEINDWFVERYVEEYDEPPNVIAGPSFSAAVAYVRALESTDGDSSSESMVNALETVSFESVYGPDTAFRQCDHAGLIPYYVTRVANVDDPEGHYLELERELSAEEAAVPCTVPGRG